MRVNNRKKKIDIWHIWKQKKDVIEEINTAMKSLKGGTKNFNSEYKDDTFIIILKCLESA